MKPRRPAAAFAPDLAAARRALVTILRERRGARTQAEFAMLFRVTQPKISTLLSRGEFGPALGLRLISVYPDLTSLVLALAVPDLVPYRPAETTADPALATAA